MIITEKIEKKIIEVEHDYAREYPNLYYIVLDEKTFWDLASELYERNRYYYQPGRGPMFLFGIEVKSKLFKGIEEIELVRKDLMGEPAFYEPLKVLFNIQAAEEYLKLFNSNNAKLK